MTVSRTLSIAAMLVMAIQTQPPWAEGRLPQNGFYVITARLELPHLERWAVDKTIIICLPGVLSNDRLPIPIISANNPFAKCSTANVMMDAPKLEYDIVCPERGSAKGHAIYVLSGNKFSGRVAMVLGAKNMTMTEVQETRRIGECSPGALGTNLSMTR
jgi:Protein of unknown function (DUF3617)